MGIYNDSIDKLNRKQIYKLLINNEQCYCEKMWENKLNRKLKPNTWKNLFIEFKETELIQLQWKILHNIYPTNILLQKIGIKHSNKCDFCEERDIIEHTFFRCKRLNNFWSDISKQLDVKLKKKYSLK